MKIGYFVRIDAEEYKTLGIGKLEDSDEGIATVAFFDGPTIDSRTYQVPLTSVRPASVSRQTRAYWFDIEQSVWRVGRVMQHDESEIDVRFPNQKDAFLKASEVFVRWDRPLKDPSAYLAQKINETPIFSDARSGFVKALMSQRRASMGMPGLFSSIIDLEVHQIEVVRRVLQDPVQRYLLADEVGLGKTIEAGVLIRQYVLDDPAGHKVAIIVPPALVLQWRDELTRRFLLQVELEDTVNVVPFDDPEGIRESLQGAGMVVVDEAHHIHRGEWIFDLLAKETARMERFLLLSATPVLGNETGFLEMLHLLDPLVFPLDSLETFRSKISNRQVLAEAAAGLIPENLLQLEDYLDTLTRLFPDDGQLIGLAGSLKQIIDEFPEEHDPAFVDALSALRAHVAETYRLDRRILRNRRKGVPGLTPDRGGVVFKDFETFSMVRLVEDLEEWRRHVALKLYGGEDTEGAANTSAWFFDLVGALASREAPDLLLETYLNPRLKIADSNEREFLSTIIEALKRMDREEDAVTAVSSIISEAEPSTKFIVFCGDIDTADWLHRTLSQHLSLPVDRYEEGVSEDYADSVFSRFQSDPNHRVIICDRRAEEGLNLQGGNKVLIHFDLPFSPNRIEQRIGRVDRYGTGSSVKSIAVRCLSSPFEVSWSNCLNKGLEVFNRSIASLQYLIDEEILQLRESLLFEGLEAIQSMEERLGGPEGKISKELHRIDDQDALDALIVQDEESYDDLFDEDDRWHDFQAGIDTWLVDVLNMVKVKGPEIGTLPPGDTVSRYMLSHRGGKETLIPLDKFLANFISVLDTDAVGASFSRPLSFPYTSRRQTSLLRRARAAKVRLLRYGDTFLKGLSELTTLDDRGRSVALWRQRSAYNADSLAADAYFRFDFLIEAATEGAAKAYAEGMSSDLDTALAAFQRRGDMIFPPGYHQVWLDSELEPVTNPTVLSLLKEPYLMRPTDDGSKDHNLNWERWDKLKDIGLPVIDYWPDLVMRARAKAELVFGKQTDLEGKIDVALRSARDGDQNRFAQLNTRIRHANRDEAVYERQLLDIEEEVAEKFYEGIRFPKISLDLIGTIFLSKHSLDHLAYNHRLQRST
jgi:ATP-dependent helicase HepA